MLQLCCSNGCAAHLGVGDRSGANTGREGTGGQGKQKLYKDQEQIQEQEQLQKQKGVAVGARIIYSEKKAEQE